MSENHPPPVGAEVSGVGFLIPVGEFVNAVSLVAVAALAFVMLADHDPAAPEVIKALEDRGGPTAVRKAIAEVLELMTELTMDAPTRA